MTTFDLDEYVYAALRAGASGFLLKDTTPEGLAAAVRVIAAGDQSLGWPSITRRSSKRFARIPVSGDGRVRRPRWTVPTAWEQEVLRLLAFAA